MRRKKSRGGGITRKILLEGVRLIFNRGVGKTSKKVGLVKKGVEKNRGRGGRSCNLEETMTPYVFSKHNFTIFDRLSA